MEKESVYGKKIRSLRTFRGFSQEYMCEKLKMDVSKYSRIETGSQKLAVEVLEKISEVLGVSIADIISDELLIIQTNSSTNGTGGIGRVENYYSDQKELFDTFMHSKNEEMVRLLKQNELLTKQVEQLIKLLEKKR